MKTLLLSTFIVFAITFSSAQSLSPSVSPSCGAYFTGGGNSLSWTMGETFTSTLSSGNNMLTQGFQQPEISVYLFNVRAFIEGFYRGNQSMVASVDPINYSLLSDTLELKLALSTAPYTILFSDKGLLQTDGNAAFEFPMRVAGNSYYLVLKQRNTAETWSKDPVTINYNTKYDFTR